MTARLKALLLTVCAIVAAPRCAAEPWQPIQRHLPPAGIEVPADDRQRLTKHLERLEKQRDALRAGDLSDAMASLVIDVDIYLKALRFALEESEFFKPQDIETAGDLLSTAQRRLEDLAAGQSPWATQSGTIVRGYRSKVDGSPQPYGLVIPADLDLSKPVPLYVWLHGRNDKLADLQFIAERSSKPGQIRPDDAIVLHPFGRSCIGWKSTAEIDVFEAIDSVCDSYPIDRDRIVLMGFSMGGAGAWHIGAHYADQFAAVHAGAGFVDVKRYQKLSPEQYPPTYEQKMWNVYDVPKYVRNLFNLPVVAYSGEVDKQKDAADFMAEAFRQEGHELVHLIGPGMGHKYDPAVLAEVMQRMHAAVAEGRNPALRQLSLQTQTLRYPRMHWIEALELDRHWQDSRIDTRYTDDDRLVVVTRNIRKLRLEPPEQPKQLMIDGQAVLVSDGPLVYERDGETWVPARPLGGGQLRKRPGLQGPIDDIFLEPFLVVVPTGDSSPQIDRWVAFELEHFRKRWKNVYRGEPRTVRDVDLKPSDCEKYHLICWGDPRSNSILREVASRLPIRWVDADFTLGGHRCDRDICIPLAIYPNPLNPRKYLVLNSGPTHREAHDRTNSLQNPKLGDWAIVDVRLAPDAEHPGRVVAAGFFDECWQLPTKVSPQAGE